LLEAGLDDALAGRGRLFVIVGDAATGKTRLADELASSAKQHGTRILWGRGWAGGGAPDYWPWTQALGDALPEVSSDEPEARFRFFEAVTAALRDQAAAQPLLLVLDDLQAADDGSILLLEFVATALPEMSALVVALGRPETARLDELERHATRVVRL
jgi:predicted ATPase